MKRMLLLIVGVLPALCAFADSEVDITKRASADGSVSVEIKSGSVEIIGWDEDEIRVQGTLGGGVKELKFDVSGGSAIIEVVLPLIHIRDGSAHLTIHVPKNSSLDVEAVSAKTDIENIDDADIDVESVSGSVRIHDCDGNIDVKNVSGGIEIEDALEDVSAHTISGSIDITGSPDSVEVESVSGSIVVDSVKDSVSVQSISGSVRITAEALDECSVETVSGRIYYTGALAQSGELEIETLSGSVDVEFTDDVRGEFDLSSFSGSITSDLNSGASVRKRRGPGSSLEFEHEDGDATVNIETFSGSITIEKN